MFGLAWTEASRSRFVAAKLEHQVGHRRRRRGGRGKVAATAAQQRHYVEQEWCYAMATSEAPRKLVLINWTNHPVLEITVSEDGSGFPKSTSTADLSVQSENREQTNQKTKRTPCEYIHCRTLAEATETLRQRLRAIPHLILIGHGLERILLEWNVHIAWRHQRCTATYPPYMEERNDPLSVLLLPGTLEDLMPRILNRRYSENLLHRAAAAMDLYKKAQQYWEEDLYKLLMQKQQTMDAKQQANKMSLSRRIAEDEKDELADLPPLPKSITMKADPTSDDMSRFTEEDDFSFQARSRAQTASSIGTATDCIFPPARERANTDTSFDCDAFAATNSVNTNAVWSSSVLHEASLSHDNTSRISGGESASWLPQDKDNTERPLDSSSAGDWLDESLGFEYLDVRSDGLLMGPPLPAKLLNDSSSSSSSDDDERDGETDEKIDGEPSPEKREESSHPVHGDDWLPEVRSQSKRFSWFGRRQSMSKSENLSPETEKTQPTASENGNRLSSLQLSDDEVLAVSEKKALSPFTARWRQKSNTAG